MPLADVPEDDLLAYDDGLMPEPRHVFLRAWVRQPGATALALVAGGRLTGYTVVRPCRVGYKFGPLFADDATTADALFRAAAAQLPPDAPIYLDVPGANPAAHDLARRYGMSPGFQTARMYRTMPGTTMTPPLERWFGVTSFELG